MPYIYLEILGTVTVVLLLIFSAFLIGHKRSKQPSQIILAAFLFTNALYILGYLLPSVAGISVQGKAWVLILWISFGYLFGPLLFVYTKSLLRKNFTFKRVYLIHFLPFMLAMTGSFFYKTIPFLYFYSVFLLFTIPYMVICFILILNYRKAIKNYFSSIDKLKLSWMLYVVGAFFIMWMVDLVNFTLGLLGMLTAVSYFFFDLFSLLINFVFTIIIFYKALNYSEILSGIPEIEVRQRYELSRLTNQEKQNYLKKLLTYFESQTPFLNHEVTISNIATKLDISVKYLSQVINESLGKNFYDFVNSYRVDYARKLLVESLDSKKTVLEILYESGFNSKSAFNLAFKKSTGYTPTEFKRISDHNNK